MTATRRDSTIDLQASVPEVQLGLQRVGVAKVAKAIRIEHAGREQTFAAEIACTVDLDPSQEGVHMSRLLELVPLATHNQGGRGTLLVGTDASVNAERLGDIVEGSMSSPVYELLKRPDELFVVEHAHLQPRFVEDSVRIALKQTLDRYPALDDADFLFSRQVNLETIHDHDVLAERGGTVGELRAELETGTASPTRTELADWLG